MTDPARASRPRRRRFSGAIKGAICGFVTYWGGAAIIATPDLVRAPASSLLFVFLRPFYTVTAWEVALVFAGAVIGATVSRYRWRGAGLLSYVGLVALVVGYFIYSLTVSIPSVPREERWASYLLLGAEGAGMGLIVIFAFYSLDAATRRQWSRLPEERPRDETLRPGVALIVPVFNEPAEMVEQTIAHLVSQAYPRDRVVVVVADDSTDAALRSRTKAFCEQVGALHHTRPTRAGFKAGAINHVLARLPAGLELVGIVDADYWVQPDYLQNVVGYFADPRISFVQTPQDYRNVDESFLTRQYKLAEAYFYQGVMPSRNEQSSIIFCGTMGILRVSALKQVGGFAEDQICEDAEVSVRLAAAGWGSLYVNRGFGKGLMPAVFDAYKKQFHRWAFGNVRILLTRTFTILASRMSWRQRFDFWFSNLHWFDGFFAMSIAAVLLYLGIGPFIGRDVVTHHQRELVMLALVPVFLLADSILRLRLVLGRSGPVRIRDALLVQGMWFSIKFTNMMAVAKCLMGRRSSFVRTPKSPGARLSRARAFFRAIRVTKLETLMAATMLGLAIANFQREMSAGSWKEMLLPAWLLLYAGLFLCAPAYAYLSYRTLRPMRHPGIPIANLVRRADPASA